MENSPIGVFDSGIGGLTVVREMLGVLPNENIVYIGDTARVPYGGKSEESVQKFTLQAIRFLEAKGVKAVVIACNTASAFALDYARANTKIPVLGVVEAGARLAVAQFSGRNVGIIGTESTVNSKAYQRAISDIKEGIVTYGLPCPLFVPLVEEGFIEGEIARLVAKEYLSYFDDKDIGSLILGCTHYPLLKDTIASVMGDEVKLLDPSRETSNELRGILERANLLRNSTDEPYLRYFVTDNPVKFKRVGESFLSRDILYIERVSIDE